MNLGYFSPYANHLWQSTVFAGVAGLLTLALRNNHARVRHWVWLAASCKFLIPLSVIIALGVQIQLRMESERTQSNLAALMDQVSEPFAAPVLSSPRFATPAPAASWLPPVLWGIWACGFLGITCSWWLRWRRIKAAVCAGSPFQLGLPIKAISSPTVLEPGVFGIFRPVLLLPEGIFERLTPAQLRGVIAHELCHVQHRDNLIAAIHMFVETAFWFHPLAWWIGRRMVEEREQACDEEVLRLGSEPRVYAEGILNVCKFYLESPLVCASGVTGADLKRRIEFITSNRVMHNLNVGRRMLLLAASVVAVGVPITIGVVRPSQGLAQSTAPATLPSFEVASIKRSLVPEGNSTWDSSPAGSLRMKNQTLRACIRIAFGLKDNQISGGPRWLDSDRYNIDAKAAGPARDPQLMLMLQVLLADRFKLSFHKETREFPGLVLVAAKNGLKIKPVQPSQNNQLNTRGGHMIAKGVSLAKLGQMLSNLMGSPVLDDTHVVGVFDFTLDWTLDDSRTSSPPTASPAAEAQSNPPPSSNTASVATDPSAGVSLISALQDQLGLKLEARKIPTEILVIDHAEKPSEN